MSEKRALRQRMRTVCAAIPPEAAAAQARAVADWVMGWPVYQRARSVMLYAALPGELDTAALLAHTLASGKRLLLPRCAAGRRLEAVTVEDLRTLSRGAFGVLEAADAPAADPTGIDLALVPGRAFDGRGHRLGYGVGCYDGFLSGLTAVSAGLAYVEQVIPAVPAEAHDVALTYLITARGIQPARCEGGGRDEPEAIGDRR